MSSKQTRKALFSSFWALLLCFAMLLGTTFAWFTDTASTSVNKIQAGTLNIQLLDPETEESLEGKTLNWVKAEGAEGEDVLWEPGCTYELQPIMIKNNGNLALKYKVDVTGIKGDAKLNEAIEWSVVVDDFSTDYADAVSGTVINTEHTMLPDEYHVLRISGHMKEEADNTYQGLSIDGVGITVYATQWTYESDSTGNQYDKDATLPSIGASDVTADTEGLTANTDTAAKTVKIESVGQLVAFANAVKSNNTYSGYTVTLESDIDLTNVNWSGIGADNYDYFPSYFFNGTFDGQGHTIYNMTVSNLVGNKSTAGFFNGLGNNAIVKNLNFENANVTSNHQAGVVAGYCCTAAGNGVVQEPKASIENCHVNNSTVISKAHGSGSSYDDGDKVGGIIGYTFFTVKDCSVKNTTIIGYRDIGGIVGYANANQYSTAAVTGNRVENVTICVDKTHDYKGYTSNDAYDAHSIIGEKDSGVTVSNNSGEATINYNTAPVSTAAELKNALDNSGNAPSYNRNIILTADIDGSSWTAISGGSNYPAVSIDGNGHTIKNLAQPLFSSLPGRDFVFKNINFTNVNISSANNRGLGVIVGEGMANGGGSYTITNCHINGGTIDGGNTYYVGGFIGFKSNGCNVTFTDCSVTDLTLKTSEESVGAFAGHLYDTVTLTNCSVKGNTSVSNSADRSGDAAKAGAFVGTVYNANVKNCTVDSTVTVSNKNAKSPLNNSFFGRNAGGTITVN